MSQGTIFAEVAQETLRAHAKHGPQVHPNGTGPAGYPLAHTSVNLDLRSGAELAEIFKSKCDFEHGRGSGTWLDILLEEIFEAAAESDLDRLRAELIQVMSVAGDWIQDIDRKAAQR